MHLHLLLPQANKLINYVITAISLDSAGMVSVVIGFIKKHRNCTRVNTYVINLMCRIFGVVL